MPPPVLELAAIRKIYDETVAVDGVSLTLGQGEFLTLLGPSGSGKTTTLMMVAGLVTPSAGVMLLDGKPLGPLPPYRRNIGLVFQNYALFPHLTVAGNIAFPLEMRGLGRAEIRARIARVLALVGLPGYEERYPDQLSGGQQQRIALARAIVFEPRLLLMDEPLGALDKKLREQMQLEIMRLHKELGISVVYVTHDQDEALVMSDRIAVFNHGRIEQLGSPEELYERPASRFVAGFIGESNFFPGIVTELVDGFCALAAGNARLRARSESRLAPGQQGVVAVRPERIRLAAREPIEPGSDNCLVGRVCNVVYLGRSRTYAVRLPGGIEVTVLLQAQERTQPSFVVGDDVVISWRAEDASAFPGE
jgi:putative spermidine/putrescine transport system ATP-binding protein